MILTFNFVKIGPSAEIPTELGEKSHLRGQVGGTSKILCSGTECKDRSVLKEKYF